MVKQKRVRLGLRVGLVAAVTSIGLWAGTGAAQAAPACTYTWNNPSGGAWGTPTNWAPIGVPGTNDTACITEAGTYTVTLGPYTPPSVNATEQNGDTIANLVVGDGASGTQTLDVSGQSFTDSSNETVNDIGLNVTGTSSIASNGVVTIDATGGGAASPMGATAEFNGGTLTNAGTINSQVEDSAWTARLGGAITNTGTINVNSGRFVMPSADEGGNGSTGGFSLSNTGTINVAANSELNVNEVQGAGASTFTQNGAIVNSGQIVATANNTGATSLTWNQNGGSETGNPVQLQSGILFNDQGGSGSFVFNAGGAGIEGTIPSSQAVTFDAESSVTSSNETSNTQALDLQGKTLTNSGTFTVDAANGGSAVPAGAEAQVNDGTIANAGTLNLQVDDPTWEDQLNAGINNQHGANVNVSGGKVELTGGGTINNDGTITIAPGANLLEDANDFISYQETFNASSDGTIVPEIANPSSFGVLTLGTYSFFNAGGTVAPKLLGGYVPSVGQEFAVFPTQGATLKGTFGSVTNGFNADYTNESANGIPLAYGPVPGTSTSTSPGTGTTPPKTAATGVPKVTRVRSVKGKVVVTLACATTRNCAAAKVKVTVVEKLRNGKVIALSALTGTTKPKPKPRTTTRTVIIATGSAVLAKGRTRTLTLSLTATGRKLLAARHSLRAVVTVTEATKTLKRATIKLTEPKPVTKKK